MATIDLTRDQSCPEFCGKTAAIAEVLGCKEEDSIGVDGLMHDCGSVANEREQYWCRQLSGIGLVDIPVDYPRTTAMSNRRQAIPIKVSGHVVEGLKKICKSCECTPYVGFLAAFQVFLSRYCGNARDIVVGAPLMFRKGLEQRSVDVEIILRLRLILNGNPSFAELLQQSHLVLREAVKHVIFPDNNEVIEELQILQDPGQSTTALNTMIILQNQNNSVENQHFEDRELFLKQGSDIEQEVNCEIVLKLNCGKMEEHSGDLNRIWEYNAELLDPNHVDSMSQNFLVMLDAVVAESTTESVWKLPLLTEDEQKKLLVEWNNTYEPQPKSDMLLHELFLDQVKTVGTNIVAATEYCSGRNITYQELKNSSEILSQQIQLLGIKSNTAIGVFIAGGTIEAIIAVFGILMAGCAYVPLDTGFPCDRIKLIAEDAELKAILVMGRAMSEVDISGAVECPLWNVRALLSNIPRETNDVDMKACQPITTSGEGDYATSPADLHSAAYIMYTSASTGKPKGVVVEHAQICHFVQLGSPRMFPGLGLGSQLLLTSPLSSDVSCGTIFPALISGALLVLASKWEIVDFLEDIILSKGISHLYITRSLFNLIAMSDLPSLQVVNITGETPQQSHIDIWRDKVPYLINAYGSTEINVVTTQQFMKTDTFTGATIGRPFPNITCFVLDELLHLVPVGAVGELYVGGPQLAREYLSRPDLTNKAFIPNPFIPGDRLYKTGDLVKYKLDGSLVFLGRNDTCVKMRGQRIELEEVETALMNVGNGTINTSMVVVIDDYLVGFVTPNDVDVSDLRNRLHNMLPTYMVPSLVIAVKSIPTTTSGKADSISLKALLEEMVANKCPSVMRQATSTRDGKPSLSYFITNNSNTRDSVKERPSFVKRGSVIESMISVQAEECLEVSLDKGYYEMLRFLKSSCNISEKQDVVVQILTDIAHAIVGKWISPQQSVMNAGIDSVTLPIFSSEIQKLIMRPAGIEEEVNAARLFEFTSLHKLSRWIVSCFESSRKPATSLLSSQCNAEPMSRPKLRANRSKYDEIAIVGMACRFPGGANSPDLFWSEVLSQGKDCIVPVLPSRLGSSSGKVWHGGLINDIDLFDNKLFGITPAEVDQMDPNQRHMLEIGYDALMRAGFTMNELQGTRCGVFVGIDNSDWAEVNSDKKNRCSAYSVMGSSDCSMSNRLSHFIGLTGPSITINTACSSSLVALDSAVASLYRGQSDMAVVGGVNVLLSSDKFKRLDATGFISANGRCRAFDASADGYVRGEGAGAVVLMPLPKAQERGCKIEALVRGTATSHCGTGSHFTAPNPSGQRQVIADALQDAGIEPQDVCYVEAHGSGTSLGDPIEIDSIISVLGNRQKNNPLVIGAVKTNIGHLEGAAGIAGLIKTILVLQYRMAPPNLHLKTINLHISNTESSLIFPSELTPLSSTANNETLFVGLSSFGAGGSNAHAILSSYASEQYSPKQEDRRVAFLFSGQGSEFVGMGRELYAQHEDFRKHLQQCDTILTENGLLDTSIIGLMYPSLRDPKTIHCAFEDNLIHETRYSQPVLFCFEWALAQILIHETTHHPFAVMGHSIGELVAACVAGILSLKDGLKLAAKRGAAMQGCPSVNGAMFALRVSRLEAEARIRDTGLLDKVVVSASNSPHSCTVSGPLNDLNLLVTDWGIAYHQLNVSHAFHSQEMQPAVPALREALCHITSWKKTSICMVSTANAKTVLLDTIHDPEYWTNQMLSPVLFSEALQNLVSSTNVSCFVEVGPRQVLANLIRDQDLKNIECINVMTNEECPMESYLKAVKGIKQLLPPISRVPIFNHVSFPFWPPTPPEPVLYTTEWEPIQPSVLSSSLSSSDIVMNMVESPSTKLFTTVHAAVNKLRVTLTNEQDCSSRSVNSTTTWIMVALGSSVDLMEGLDCLVSALKSAFEQSCCLLVVTEGVLGGNSWRGAWILGFLRSARIEFAGLNIDYIDFCSGLTLVEATTALSYILNNKNHGVEMVVNPGPILKIARLTPMPIDILKNSGESLNLHSYATYIISGGLGVLGLRAAQTLIKNGACHLILLSRSGVPNSSESHHLLSSIQENKNVKLECIACDISTDVGIKTIKAITQSWLTVKGIVHAAGVMTEPDSILNTTLASLERTLSPKLQGAWNLHLMSLQEGWKLDFFVVYSSASGILGFGGLSPYAAANTALDALIQLRRGLNLCGTSLQWGEWGIGMGTKTMKSDSVAQITPDLGSSILEATLAHPDTTPPEILVLPSQNWSKYTHLLRQEQLPLFARVVVPETPQGLDISSSSQCNVSHITDNKNWLKYMCEMAARVAGRPVNPTDKSVTVMDSLAQMEFYHRLNDALVEAGRERLKSHFLSMGIFSLESLLAFMSTSAEDNNNSSSSLQREEESFTVDPGDHPSEIEASYEQAQMYLIHMTMPDKSTYNQLLGVRLRNAPVDIDAIRYALDMVWGHYDVLRATLRMVSPPPQYIIMQYIKSVSEVPHFPLKLCTAADGASLTQHLRDALQEPFNMEEGPLIWARLVTLGPEDITLLLVIHHAICDAHSCKSIINEIMTAYSDRMDGRESSLEPRAAIQYSDYAVAQRKWLDPNGERFLNYLTYWKDKLADLKPIDLPLDRPRAPVLSNRGAVIHVSVPFNVIDALQKVCHAKSCTLLVGITSLWGLLLARYSGDASEVVVGIPYNSRNHKMYEMQGDVINLLPLRLNFRGDSTFGGLLERTNKDVQDAVKNGDGFAGVVMGLGIVPDPSRTPLFDTVMILQDSRVSTDNMKADVLRKVGASEVEIISRGHPFMDEISRSSFEISCEFTTPGPGSDMKGVITYNTDLFDEVSIQKIADSYFILLDEAGRLGVRSNVWNLPLLN